MKKRFWIIGNCILLILVLILFLISGTMAAYTSRSFVKGVATTPKQGLGLSSDYLSVVSKTASTDNYAVRKILLEEKDESDNSPYVITFYVQNSSDGTVNKNSMQYSLFATGLPEGATIRSTERDITDDATGAAGATAPLMPAYTKTTHTYQISIPKAAVNEASDIIIKAIPDADSDSSGNILAAKFQLSIAGVMAGFSYKGNFIDETPVNKPSEYVAFNYEVLVFNATESHQMVLTWDTDYVEIDPLFLERIVATPGTNGSVKSVEFPMDAENNSYLIKFYRLKGQDINENWQRSWDNLKNIITFTEK
ncbi:MAG: hypothetical protein ACI4LC_07740 [Emergencia sp.]